MEWHWPVVTAKATHDHATPEPWAVDDPNLPRIEGEAISALGSAWNTLRDNTLAALGLAGKGMKAGEAVFNFDISGLVQRLLAMQAEFIASNTQPDAAFFQAVLNSWLRGVENAAASIDKEEQAARVIQQSRDDAVRDMDTTLRAQLEKTAVRAYADDIVEPLRQGAYNGENPNTVAHKLRARFKAHNYDWERLARSEVAASHAVGQLQALANMGISQYDFDANPDACERCRKLMEAGPYRIGQGPLPVRDSHPNCRCGVAARI